MLKGRLNKEQQGQKQQCPEEWERGVACDFGHRFDSDAVVGKTRRNKCKRWWSTTQKTKITLAFLLLWLYSRLVIVCMTPVQLHQNFAMSKCQFLEGQKETSLKHHGIAVVTAQRGMDARVVEASVENKRAYANKHGYDFLWVDDQIDTSRPAAWSKFPILKKYLDHYDFLVWMDIDAMIMNFDIAIDRITDNRHELFFAQDENSINSGVFIVRSSDWSKWYLDECWNQEWLVKGAHPFEYEQRAIHYIFGTEKMEQHAREFGYPLYSHVDQVRDNIKVVPSCALNSNICETFLTSLFLYRRHPVHRQRCDNLYHTGDFILHLAGKKPAAWHRNWLLLEFAAKAKRENAKYFIP